MKHPLGKTELTGLILLAILIVAITGCALLVKGCGEPSQGAPEVRIEIVDTLPAPAATTAVKKEKIKGEKKKKTNKGKKGKETKKKTSPPARDPFGDTIPTY